MATKDAPRQETDAHLMASPTERTSTVQHRPVRDPIELVIGNESSQNLPHQEQNRGHIKDLRALIDSTATVVPFVGAGLSIPFGYPGWSPFLLKCADQGGIRSQIQLSLDQGAFEEAASQLEEKLGRKQFNGLIKKVFGAEPIYRRQSGAPARVLWHIASISKHLVVTTNFDRLLERAFRRFSTPFDQVIVGPKLAEIDETTFGRSKALLKLHGDCVDPNDRVLTKAEYDKSYGPGPVPDMTKPAPRMLRRAIEGKALLFIGCALARDRTLSLLTSLTEEHEYARHYAIVSAPEEGAESIEAFCARLYSSGINPIVYPKGRHECVLRVLEYLAPSGAAPLPLRRSYLATGLVNVALSVVFMLFNRIQELPHYGAVILGIPVLVLTCLPVLWSALKHAHTAPSVRWSDRLLPVLDRGAAENTIWNRFMPFVAFVCFPIYTACHLVIRMTYIGGIFERNAPTSTFDGPALYDWRNFDWESLKGHKWVWHDGHGLSAYPALEPQVWRGGAVACALLGIWLLLVIFTGFRANRIRAFR